jgi:putative ABC transport system permease protein
MKILDLLKDAIKNTNRNKVRTSITVIAIFIGAFTLTITQSIGTGVSSYVTNQINSIGSPTIISVIKPVERVETSDVPEIYQPADTANPTDGLPSGSSPMGMSYKPITNADLVTIENIKNVEYVEPTVMASPNFIQYMDGEKYVVNVNMASQVTVPDLTAGKNFTTETDNYEVILPSNYVEVLGFSDTKNAIGETTTFGITDYTGTEHTVEATIVGVQNKSLFGSTVSLNPALTEELADLQKQGLPVQSEKTYISVVVNFSENLNATQIDALKADLVTAGFEGTTVADQLGSVQSVINGIIGILNAFAIIALVAAGFGIVNTLLMSVQERTREIGLMKAMGMSAGKIYAMFSLEAIFIGFLGSAIGAGAAIALGTGISSYLSETVLSDLEGLNIMLFTIPSTLTVMGIVMFIAFLAGTIPASRAAKQNPIDALRYE